MEEVREMEGGELEGLEELKREREMELGSERNWRGIEGEIGVPGMRRDSVEKRRKLTGKENERLV